MKTLGLIGGMSAESTQTYYQIINHEVNQRLGGNHSAKIVMHSVDFQEIVAMQQEGNWAAAGQKLAQCAADLERIGAEAIVICTNTMHKVSDAVAAAVSIPLLHVVDITAAAVKARGIQRVALLGTRFTMSDGFYVRRMMQQDIEVLTPDAATQDALHRIIFDELCIGITNPLSRQVFANAIHTLKNQGAQGVIFGCTEIGLLLAEADSPLPVFDSTLLHARAAAEFALQTV